MERVVSFKADVFLVEALDRVARSLRRPRSEVIREAIVNYIYASLSKLPESVRREVLELLEKAVV